MYGIQTAYQNILDHRRREASPEVLMATLSALGAPVNGPADVAGALRERRQQICRRGGEPVIVIWDGESARFRFQLPAGRVKRPFQCSLKLETGEERQWTVTAERSSASRAKVDSGFYLSMSMQLPAKLPPGYHELLVEAGNTAFHALIISAPRRAFVRPRDSGKKASWGIFAPVYALHSKASWGVGDLGDLQMLMRWVQQRGGTVVGTLPLLASFLGKPFDPSPYSPVSRLFWNELLLDMSRIPELSQCPPAQRLVASPEFQAERKILQSQDQVDYRRAMVLKRRVLELLARSIFATTTSRRGDLLRYIESHPDLEDYARFRAACDRCRTSWWNWPEPARSGTLGESDYRPSDMRYHLYVQWLAEQQISCFAKGPQANGEGLYMDLPLGVNPDGYDVWRERASFVLDVSVGAPPDEFFTRGQCWGFPPMHPEKIREQGYQYFRQVLRHHLRHAGLLRIDHVMGLHRLFWIPKGFEPQDGAYVRYPAEELYAILALESVRNKTVIVGEDLGTVPPYVRPALARHKIQKMYVLQFEATPDKNRPLARPATDSVATINTHDMPPFTAFWKGLDVQDRVDLGLLDHAGAAAELERRSKLRAALVAFLRRGSIKKHQVSLAEVLKGCLQYLGASGSRLVIVNLEDLWFEEQPQNVPGTCNERPNWKRKTRYSLEEIVRMKQLAKMLAALDRTRRRKEFI